MAPTFYQHQTSGPSAGMFICDSTHQMEKIAVIKGTFIVKSITHIRRAIFEGEKPRTKLCCKVYTVVSLRFRTATICMVSVFIKSLFQIISLYLDTNYLFLRLNNFILRGTFF